MIIRLGLSLVLPALIASMAFAADAMSFGFVGTLLTVCLIVGFAVAAAGWTVRKKNASASLRQIKPLD